MVKKYIMTKISTTKPIINRELVQDVPVVVPSVPVSVVVGMQLTSKAVMVINPMTNPRISSFVLRKPFLLINAVSPGATRGWCVLSPV